MRASFESMQKGFFSASQNGVQKAKRLGLGAARPHIELCRVAAPTP